MTFETMFETIKKCSECKADNDIKRRYESANDILNSQLLRLKAFQRFRYETPPPVIKSAPLGCS